MPRPTPPLFSLHSPSFNSIAIGHSGGAVIGVYDTGSSKCLRLRRHKSPCTSRPSPIGIRCQGELYRGGLMQMARIFFACGATSHRSLSIPLSAAPGVALLPAIALLFDTRAAVQSKVKGRRVQLPAPHSPALIADRQSPSPIPSPLSPLGMQVVAPKQTAPAQCTSVQLQCSCSTAAVQVGRCAGHCAGAIALLVYSTRTYDWSPKVVSPHSLGRSQQRNLVLEARNDWR